MLTTLTTWWTSNMTGTATQEKPAEAPYEVRKVAASPDKMTRQQTSFPEKATPNPQASAFTPAPAAALTPSTKDSASRHGFTDDEDEPSLSPSSAQKRPSSAARPSARVSRHGFSGQLDSDGSDEENRFIPSGAHTNSKYLPACPSPEKRRGQGRPLFPGSPPVPRARGRRAFELPAPAARHARASSTDGGSADDLGELQELSRRLQAETRRRDQQRERQIAQEQLRRKELLESDAHTQRLLMKKFEDEELATQRARQAKAEEVRALLSTDCAFRLEDVASLLQQAGGTGVALPSGAAADLQKLLRSGEDVLQKLRALTREMLQADEAQASPAELDQLRMLLQDPLCRRLQAGGRCEAIEQGAQLLEAESRKLDQIRKAREEVQLPPIPQLAELRRKLSALSAKDESTALAASFDVEDLLLLADPAVPLTKKQRLQLWAEVFQLIVDGAAHAADAAGVRAFSLLTFGLFFLLQARGGEAQLSRAGKMFIERVHKANSVSVPSFAARDAETLRGPALGNVMRLLGGVVALELENPVCVSHATAWTWLVRSVKLMQKAVLKLSESAADSSLNDELSENVLDTAVALRAFLGSGGGVLLSVRYQPQFFDAAGGVLAGLKLALSAFVERFMPKFSYIPQEEREFLELRRLVDVGLARGALEEEEPGAGEDELKAAMLSQLAERRKFQALQVMAAEE